MLVVIFFLGSFNYAGFQILVLLEVVTAGASQHLTEFISRYKKIRSAELE